MHFLLGSRRAAAVGGVAGREQRRKGAGEGGEVEAGGLTIRVRGEVVIYMRGNKTCPSH